MRYQYRILQTGTLPLRPDSSYQRVEHRCTSALIWPTGVAPTPENSVLTDPCFTFAGFAEARKVAAEVGINLSDIRHVFNTHGHGDHLLNFPPGVERPAVAWFRPVTDVLSETEIVPCPGHSEDSCALVFRDDAGIQVWVAGDAVLDRDWLVAWGYYWPNGYLREEIIQTYHSVAKILSGDIIIPGHGEPIKVTADLCDELDRRFDLAEYARECGVVRQQVQQRAKALRLSQSED
ncbi:MAG: MBL fold metallo-hydrolase [Gemmataceae bacterium]